MPARIGAGIGGLAALVLCVAFPLATYTAAIACFGLAHVLGELDYLGRRFGARVRGGLVPLLAAPIALAMAARGAGLFRLVPPSLDAALEIAAAAALAGAVVSGMRRARAAGAAAAVVLAGGAVLAPFQALLALALLHNLTPLGFIAEALGGRRRRRAVGLLCVPFVLLPLLIASGLPGRLIAAAGFGDPEASLFAAAGPLALNLGAYLPPRLAAGDWALPAFSACVLPS